MFVLDVIVNFTRLSEEQLFQQLKRIKIQSEEEENTTTAYANVGYLTSLSRNEWAHSRAELIRGRRILAYDIFDNNSYCFFLESTNRDCLDMIERCTFIICLDKKVEAGSYLNDKHHLNEDSDFLENLKNLNETEKEMMECMAHQMLHGCGSKYNSGNRWFDKTMQFIISEDGTYGINFEHSPAEGIVVIELSEHLFRYM
jgi:carnitine O-acetyltransferase